MKKKARAHVIIKGRVQGVFFRVNTARAANRLGVCGWVKNRWDGNVEAVFEGEEDRVNAILEWCNIGDAPAKVSGVDLEWEEFTGAYNSFDITS
jgi:acylphosphatase